VLTDFDLRTIVYYKERKNNLSCLLSYKIDLPKEFCIVSIHLIHRMPYDPQEVDEETNLPLSMKGVKMGVTQLYTQGIHGNSSSADGHYLLLWIPPREECFQLMQYYGSTFYCKIELVKVYMLPSGELMCVLYTHYLRLIQRKWRKKYRERMERAKHMSLPRNFTHRLRYGFTHK